MTMPADTNPIDLAGLRVLLEKMTPRPWEADLDVFDMAQEGVVACVHSRDNSLFFTIGMDLTLTESEWTREKADAQYDEAKGRREYADAAGIVAIVNAAGALLDRVEALEAGLLEACEIALCAIAANEILPSTNSEAIERIHATLLPPEAPRAGEAG